MQAVHFLLLAVVAEPADVEAATLLRSHWPALGSREVSHCRRFVIPALSLAILVPLSSL